jgi:hypothetical protein
MLHAISDSTLIIQSVYDGTTYSYCGKYHSNLAGVTARDELGDVYKVISTDNGDYGGSYSFTESHYDGSDVFNAKLVGKVRKWSCLIDILCRAKMTI